MNIENKFDPKIDQSLNIKISHHGSVISRDENCEEEYDLKKGAIIGGEHYGFTLVVDKNGVQNEETYPTQCRILAIEMVKSILCVYEEHKYVSWQFNNKGQLLRVAQFLKSWRPDIEYLAELGITAEKDIDELNKKAYRSR